VADLTSKLQLNISDFLAALSKAAQGAGTLQKALTDAASGAGKFDKAAGDLDKLAKEAKEAEKASESLGAAMQKAEKASSELGKNGSGALAGLTAKFKEGQKSASEGGGIFGSLAGKLGELASPAGAATVAIGALAAGVTKSIEVGKEFETGMQSLSAVTGLSGAPLDDLGERARNLAKQFGTSATEQLESFQGVLSKFGPQLADTPEALSKVSENINTLAKAGGLDAKTSMEALANSMLQFGVNVADGATAANESTRFINALAASAKVGASEIPQVADAIVVAGVAAKGANVSFEETNAAVQVLAAGGKLGAEAGTALRNVLGKIAGEDVIPKDAREKLKGLGVDFNKLSDTSLPLSERLGELKKAQKDATAIAKVFGTENAAAANILIDGSATMADWTKQITGTNEAQAAAAKNMATFSESMKRLTATFEDLGISVYQKIAPALTFLSDGLNGLVGGGEAGALTPLVEGFKKAYAAIKPVVDFLVNNVILFLQIQFEYLKTTVGVVFSAFGDYFGRIGAIIAPLIEQFKGLFGSVGGGIDVLEIAKNIFKVLGDVLGTVLRVALGTAAKLFEVLVSGIRIGVSWIQQLVTWVKSVADSFGAWIGKSDTLKGVIAAVTGTITGFTSAIGKVKDAVLNFLGMNGEKVEIKAEVSKDKLDTSSFNKYYSDIKALSTELLKVDDKVAQQRKEKYKADLEEKLKADIAAGKLTQSQADELNKQLDKIHGKVKLGASDEDAEKQKTQLQKLQDQLKAYAEEQNGIAEEIEIKQKRIAAASGRDTLNAEENLIIQRAKLEALTKISDKTQELLKGTDAKPVKLKLDSESGETTSGVNKIVQDANKAALDQKLVINKLTLKDVKKDIADQVKSLLEDVDVSLDVIGANGIDKAKDDAKEIIAKLKELADEAVKAGDQKQADAILKQASKLRSDLYNNVEKYTKQERDIQIQAIADKDEREKASRIASLQDKNEALQEELESNDAMSQEAANARLDIIRKNEEEIAKLRIKSNEDTLDAIGKDFLDSITKEVEAKQKADAALAEEKGKNAETYEKDLADLRSSLAKRQTSYADYQKKLAEIEQKRSEGEEKTNEKQQGKLVAYGKATSAALQKQAEKTSKELADGLEKGTIKGGQAFDMLGQAAALSFGAMIAAGETWQTAALKTIFQTVSQAISLFTPQILAIFTGFIPPPFGQIAGFAAIGVVEGLLAAASAGFKEGGYTGDGATNAVAGVVHRGEFVNTAETTERERPLLEWIHKGRSSAEYFGRFGGVEYQRLSSVAVTADGQLMQTHLLGEVVARLGNVEKAIIRTGGERRNFVELNASIDEGVSLRTAARHAKLKAARS